MLRSSSKTETLSSRRMPSPVPGRIEVRGLVVLAEEIVVAISEEGEVVGAHPGEELARLVDLLGRQRRRQFLELEQSLLDLAPHGPPIRDRGAHIRQHALEIAADPVEAMGIALLVRCGSA